MQFCTLGEVYSGGPENQHGQALVGESEVSPDCGEVLGGDYVTHSEQGYCDHEAFQCGTLIHFEGFRYDQTGGAESGVTTGDGQDYYRDNCEDTANRSEQGVCNFRNYCGRGSGSDNCVECFGGFVERQAEGTPDQADDTFDDHCAVEYGAAFFFIFYAACHERRLGCVETADCAAGQGDEKKGPDGFITGVEVYSEIKVGQHFVTAEHECDSKGYGHDQQQCAEQGVEFTDEFIDGQNGSEEVVTEDAGYEDSGLYAGQSGEQLCGSEYEYNTDQHKQYECENTHQLTCGHAEVFTDQFGYGCAVVADGKHTAEVVMDCSGEDATDNDPDKGYGTVQGTEDGAEDGTDSGDIQNLNEHELPHGHGHVVNIITHGICGGGAVCIRGEHIVHEFTVKKITDNKGCHAGKEK